MGGTLTETDSSRGTAGCITGFPILLGALGPTGISDIEAVKYLTGLRNGEYCELGRAVLG
jgi:hypothetical protein